jgi:hypothetical protein
MRGSALSASDGIHLDLQCDLFRLFPRRSALLLAVRTVSQADAF